MNNNNCFSHIYPVYIHHYFNLPSSPAWASLVAKIKIIASSASGVSTILMLNTVFFSCHLNHFYTWTLCHTGHTAFIESTTDRLNVWNVNDVIGSERWLAWMLINRPMSVNTTSVNVIRSWNIDVFVHMRSLNGTHHMACRLVTKKKSFQGRNLGNLEAGRGELIEHFSRDTRNYTLRGVESFIFFFRRVHRECSRLLPLECGSSTEYRRNGISPKLELWKLRDL